MDFLFKEWQLGISDLHQPVRYISQTEMVAEKQTIDGDAICTVWTGHPELGADFTVTVRQQKLGDSLFSGTIEYEHYEGRDHVEEIHFPIVRVPLTGDMTFLSAASDMGKLYTHAEAFKLNESWEESYRAMQFCAFLSQQNDCLYLDHRDSQGNTKKFKLTTSADGKECVYAGIHPLSCHDDVSRSFCLPYENTLGTFHGSWYDAAQIYKKWARGQRWNSVQNQANRLRDIGIWVWNRGLAKEAVPPVERLLQESGVPVALDWYWWHHNPYDTDYPDFWPPREGVDSFRDTVAHLNECGIFSQVYINGVCWDHDGVTWDNGGAAGAAVRRDGSIIETAFNKYNNHRLAYMCGEADQFHDRIAELVKNLRDAGLNGQYLDMIGGMNGYLCHNPEHQHPKNDPAIFTTGYRKLLARLKAENPDFPLTTEYANEAFMDLVDGAIICLSSSPERFDIATETVPLFSAVYHGKLVLFGNYATPDGIPPWDPLWPAEDRWENEKPWHKLFPDQFFIEMARPVIWGAQPMVCNLRNTIFDDPEFKELYDFIIETARFYYHNREFLLDGDMMSPAGFSCNGKDVSFFHRMIFTKEKDCSTIKKSLPTILHSVWQNDKGVTALFLANYTAEEQSWSFHDRTGVLKAHSYEKIIL